MERAQPDDLCQRRQQDRLSEIGLDVLGSAVLLPTGEPATRRRLGWRHATGHARQFVGESCHQRLGVKRIAGPLLARSSARASAGFYKRGVESSKLAALAPASSITALMWTSIRERRPKGVVGVAIASAEPQRKREICLTWFFATVFIWRTSAGPDRFVRWRSSRSPEPRSAALDRY